GLLAGINAARLAEGRSLQVLSRESSYIGTLIDDLCTKELREPYRMLTSRSEYRLILRSDNADSRLTPLGREIGLIDDRRWQLFQNKQAAIAAEIERLNTHRVKATDPAGVALGKVTGQSIKGSATLADLLRRSGLHYAHLAAQGLGNNDIDNWEGEAAEIAVKYSGYIQRQQQQIERMAKQQQRSLPADLDYAAIETISKEAREKLARVRPLTIGQAARIGGVNPADINALLVYLEVRSRRNPTPVSAAT
ncbi:MAG: tRNA uridine-5-carboxymethylaminomethyl(34) synthesis enzyme MnmG, partial [Cyanobacteria bacterium J06648_11]